MLCGWSVQAQMAKWLFSGGFDSAGNPVGIGLSAWRFNIGGGTAEQGDSSGIDQVHMQAFWRPCWNISIP